MRGRSRRRPLTNDGCYEENTYYYELQYDGTRLPRARTESGNGAMRRPSRGNPPEWRAPGRPGATHAGAQRTPGRPRSTMALAAAPTPDARRPVERAQLSGVRPWSTRAFREPSEQRGDCIHEKGFHEGSSRTILEDAHPVGHPDSTPE